MEVMGLMLGEFVDDYTVRCTDVFAMPQSGTGVSVEAVDPVFQTKMLDMLKQTGRYGSPPPPRGWPCGTPTRARTCERRCGGVCCAMGGTRLGYSLRCNTVGYRVSSVSPTAVGRSFHHLRAPLRAFSLGTLAYAGTHKRIRRPRSLPVRTSSESPSPVHTLCLPRSARPAWQTHSYTRRSPLVDH